MPKRKYLTDLLTECKSNLLIQERVSENYFYFQSSSSYRNCKRHLGFFLENGSLSLENELINFSKGIKLEYKKEIDLENLKKLFEEEANQLSNPKSIRLSNGCYLITWQKTFFLI